ncbi:MAG: TIGR04282 family arsenosugar biosynthesis glycosyltransferase [Bacteroidota bacterium]
MQKTGKNALIVFIKNPEIGKVKTRLAKTVGDEKALAVYKALMEHTRKIAEALSVNRRLFYSQFINESDNWSRKKFQKDLQIEADLGTKMATAFHTVFKTNEKVVIIGSDCASLTPQIVRKAFKKLDEHDFVIGPAMDGGYYLLGMNQFAPEVFHNIEWSTEVVCSTTMEQIKDLNKSYFLLPELSDIDYEEDWLKYGWDLPGYPINPNNKYKKVVIPPQTNA